MCYLDIGVINWLTLSKVQSQSVCVTPTNQVLVRVVTSELPREKQKKDTKNQEFELVKQSGHTKTFLSGLVIGGMVGAVTMLLMAPQPGEQTRTELQGRAIELRDRTATTVKETMTQVRAKANQIKADVQIKAVDLRHQGQDMLVKQLDHVSQAAEAGKKALQGSANHTVV